MSTRPDVGQGGHGGHGGQGGHGGAADGGAGGVAGTGGTADGGAGDVTTAATSGTVVTRMREIRRVSPWSALRMGFALSVCLFAVWFIAAVLVFILMSVTGVWDRFNGILGDVTGFGDIGVAAVLGAVIAVGVFEVIVFTVLAPVVAVIYNACAEIVGGLRVEVATGVDDALSGDAVPAAADRDAAGDVAETGADDAANGVANGAADNAAQTGADTDADDAAWGRPTGGDDASGAGTDTAR
ncbi:DUF3566 domain-containing protein [Corynebacterium bovis]|uniref:DUF3566 domain-containing protein n=1 Tax=Corynebacterium bovis DSM 20582 = CIP 54.80 TaxID=927655 RepID=A0A8H9Y8F1_9CORY|nr:DUF3566 domain-containing protein [Corynebacterium bovis]MBB3115975.1 hypothetical protein [Corynebacterium bovis DSM 20582 = CIP 54.80]QQC46924.1 DUF3566 domain-containing protein [Corynebacterium bovis]RRO83803.1 hypothetical protein CXF36_01890 [Corynebacterium bovis]RRO84955.1 hypothetical protein CXF37_01370 [Corynebacterium bovis]RRQ13992.1 hypothetical protein CXF47_04035 [Corynebacterium bovis]